MNTEPRPDPSSGWVEAPAAGGKFIDKTVPCSGVIVSGTTGFTTPSGSPVPSVSFDFALADGGGLLASISLAMPADQLRKFALHVSNAVESSIRVAEQGEPK